MGDFIGGVVGTVFAMSGTILLYLTLTIQRREHMRAIGEMRNDQSFNTCVKFISDVQARVWLFEFDGTKGVRALLLMAKAWHKEADQLLEDLALRKAVNVYSDDSRYAMKSLVGVYGKLNAAISILERPGIDPIVALALVVDVEDILHQLDGVRFEAFSASLALRTCDQIISRMEGDERMDHISISLVYWDMSFVEREHTELRRRLASLRQSAMRVD